MNENIGGEILRNPDNFVLIKNKEQLLDVYPNWFEKINIESSEFYIEKKPEKRTLPGHRYIITPSGMVKLEGRSEFVWEVNENSNNILKEANIYAAQEYSKFRDRQPVNTNLKLIDLGNNYSLGITFIPYGQDDGTFADLARNHAFDKADKDTNIE